MALGVRFAEVEQRLADSDPLTLQAAWSRRSAGIGPYEVADLISGLADAVLAELQRASNDIQHAAIGYVLEAADEGEIGDNIPGSRKLAANALAILSGLLVGSWFNSLDWHRQEAAAA